MREPEPEAWAPNKPGRRLPAVEGSQPIRSGAELRASWGPQAAGIDFPPHRPEETSMGAATGSAIDRAKYEIKRRGIDIGQRNLTSEERQTVSDHCAVSEATVYAAQRELKSEAVQAFAAAGVPAPDVEQASAPLDRSAREIPEGPGAWDGDDPIPTTANGSEPPHPGPWYREEPVAPEPEPRPAPGPSRPDWQEQVRRAAAARGPAPAPPGPADVRVPPLLGAGLCDEAETALEIAAGEIPDDWRDMAASVRLQVLRLAVRAIQAVLGA